MDRTLRFALWALVVLAGLYVAEPYVSRWRYSAEAPRAVAPRAELAGSEQTAVDIFKRISPSVVHVFARPRGAQATALGGSQAASRTGTGFAWDPAGHIVTNNHVIEGAGQIAVKLASGDVVPAEIVGRAPAVDLAVLRLVRPRSVPPPIPVGSSADLAVGQAAYAIGNPFGLKQTLTSGIVSALQRRLPSEEGRELQDLIQTDAAINPGNSGGPLIDSSGRLIGVNTAIFSPSGASAGIGFAVTVDVVNRVVPELIRTGRVPSPGIGIVAARGDTAAQLGIEGVVVVRTLRGSPAERAGIRGVDGATGEIGDIIVAVDGTPVRNIGEFGSAVTRAGIGKSVRLTIIRDGRRGEVEVAVADSGSSERQTLSHWERVAGEAGRERDWTAGIALTRSVGSV